MVSDAQLLNTITAPLDYFGVESRKSLGSKWLCWYRGTKGLLTSEDNELSEQKKGLRVSTVGVFRVMVDGIPLELNHEALRKVIAMLVFSDGYTCRRDFIACTIWPDATRSKSLASLRQTILHIKNSFQSICGDDIPFKSDLKTISLVDCSVCIDVHESIKKIKSRSPIQNLKDTKKKISQGFLPSLFNGSDVYTEWVNDCRDAFRDELKTALRSAIESIDSFESKLQYAELLSMVDPCDELACRAKMQVLHSTGEQGKALKCYADLWRQLEEEYDIEPSSITQELAVAVKMNEQPVGTTDKSSKLFAQQVDQIKTEIELDYQGDDFGNEHYYFQSPKKKNDSIFESIVPRIAVIPFVGRGVNEDQKYIGEVLADDLINVLSKCNTISVISRLSGSVFSGLTGVQQTIHMLNVQYLMSGSYRMSADKIVLSIEFSCADSSSILWEKRFSGTFDEFLQGDHGFVEDALRGMGIGVMANELRKTSCRPLNLLDDYTLLISAIALMHRLTKESFNRSNSIMRILIERNPTQALPLAYLSMWYVLSVVQGWSRSPNKDGEIAYSLSSKALDLDPFLSLAHTLHGLVNTTLKKDLELGEASYSTALEYNQSDSLAWLLRGTLYAFQGKGQDAISDTSKALSISPFDPNRYFYYSLAGTAAVSAQRYDEAIHLAKKSLRLNSKHASTLRVLCVALWKTGKYEESRRYAKSLLAVQPSFTVSSWLENTPYVDCLAEDISSVLIDTGMPK